MNEKDHADGAFLKTCEPRADCLRDSDFNSCQTIISLILTAWLPLVKCMTPWMLKMGHVFSSKDC